MLLSFAEIALFFFAAIDKPNPYYIHLLCLFNFCDAQKGNTYISTIFIGVILSKFSNILKNQNLDISEHT